MHLPGAVFLTLQRQSRKIPGAVALPTASGALTPPLFHDLTSKMASRLLGRNLLLAVLARQAEAEASDRILQGDCLLVPS